jgi:hypothetical protein
MGGQSRVGATPQRWSQVNERRIVDLLPTKQNVPPAVRGVRGKQILGDDGVRVVRTVLGDQLNGAHRVQQNSKLVRRDIDELQYVLETGVRVRGKKSEDVEFGCGHDGVKQRRRVDQELEAFVQPIGIC